MAADGVHELQASIPPLHVVRRTVDALRAAGSTPAIGGSGLLVALGLADVARDWDVELVDAAPALLVIAARRCPDAPARVADIGDLAPTAAFDAVTCRGVLNDLLHDAERHAAVDSLAGQLRPGGVLVLDVREQVASRARATGRAERRRVDLPDGGHLTFTSSTSWSDGHLLVRETHDLRRGGDRSPERHEYEFTMRPWTEDELRHAVLVAGLSDVDVRPGVGRRTDDRRLVTARAP